MFSTEAATKILEKPLKRWLLKYSGQSQKSNQTTHTQKSIKRVSCYRTSKSRVGIWYIYVYGRLTPRQLPQYTVISLCEVRLPRKYSYFLERVLKEQPFTSMHNGAFSQNQVQLKV